MYIYTLRIYYDTDNYNITAVLLHVVGTQEVDIQYTAVRVNVRLCTYPVHSHIIHTLQQRTATAVVVLQLLALSAAACLSTYHYTYFATTNSNSSCSATAASFVCCCLPYAIHSSIDSSVLLLLDLNCVRVQ